MSTCAFPVLYVYMYIPCIINQPPRAQSRALQARVRLLEAAGEAPSPRAGGSVGPLSPTTSMDSHRSRYATQGLICWVDTRACTHASTPFTPPTPISPFFCPHQNLPTYPGVGSSSRMRCSCSLRVQSVSASVLSQRCCRPKHPCRACDRSGRRCFRKLPRRMCAFTSCTWLAASSRNRYVDGSGAGVVKGMVHWGAVMQ